jgi:hypothetical protein
MPETGEEEDILLKAVRRLNQTGDNGSSEGEGAEAQEKHTTRNSAQAAVTSQSRGRSFDEKNPLFRASSLDSNSSWASGLRKSRSPLGESPRRRYPAAPDSTAPQELVNEEGAQKHRQSEFEHYQQHAHASGSEEEEGDGGDQRYRSSALQREGCQDGDEYEEEERYEQEEQRYDEEEDEGFARQQVFLKSSLNRALTEP